MPLTWELEARRILKAELARAGVSYKTLVVRLAVIGVDESEANLSNKISRGRFTFVFFMQCMHALGVSKVDISTGIKPGALDKR